MKKTINNGIQDNGSGLIFIEVLVSWKFLETCGIYKGKTNITKKYFKYDFSTFNEISSANFGSFYRNQHEFSEFCLSFLFGRVICP